MTFLNLLFGAIVNFRKILVIATALIHLILSFFLKRYSHYVFLNFLFKEGSPGVHGYCLLLFWLFVVFALFFNEINLSTGHV